MILCVTLNPCLDKTLTVPAWKPGDLVRGNEVREVVGGKGNNVARALKRLGRSTRPATFLGGQVGSHCLDLLRREDGLDPIAVETESPTRVILTVRTESKTDQTAFFDPDPVINSAEADALIGQIEKALSTPGISAMALSGSSPSAATHGIFSELIPLARSRRIPVFLDTYGPALESIWGFWPSVIQLNRKEAAGRLRASSPNDQEILKLLGEWHGHGVSLGLVTDGPGPVLIQAREKRFRAMPAPIKAVNPIGAGDSLLAGLIDGWLKGLDVEPLIRHALGCAAANASVWDAGAVDPELAGKLADEVVLEPIGED